MTLRGAQAVAQATVPPAVSVFIGRSGYSVEATATVRRRADRSERNTIETTAVTRRGTPHMKVWIDQDLCTGDGLCEEIAPDVFTLLDDGLAYVKEGDKIFATAKGNAQGADGLANVPAGQEEAVIESAEECPGECIFIEVD
jgi:ferredoxin